MTPDLAALSERAALSRYRFGQSLVLISALAWSTAGYFTRLIPLDLWTLLFWRGLFGALTALCCILVTERGKIGRAFTGMGWPGLQFTLLSTAGMMCFLGALKLTTVAHVAIVYATVPLAAAALGWLVLRESVSAATLWANALALVGIGVTVMQGFGEGSLAGDALTLLMTLLMAAMIVLLRRARGRIAMVPAAGLSGLLSSLVTLPFATPLATSPGEILELAAFGVSNMGLGLIAFTIGASFVPAAETALLGLVDAPLAPIWVWLAFGETPSLGTIAGGSLVLVAVLGHILYESRKPTRLSAHEVRRREEREGLELK